MKKRLWMGVLACVALVVTAMAGVGNATAPTPEPLTCLVVAAGLLAGLGRRVIDSD